jgi:hypothetical protein
MTVRETAEIVTRQAAPMVLAGKVPGEQTPLAHADHAVRACYAALRMQESVKTVHGRGPPHRRRAHSHPRRREFW